MTTLRCDWCADPVYARRKKDGHLWYLCRFHFDASFQPKYVALNDKDDD